MAQFWELILLKFIYEATSILAGLKTFLSEQTFPAQHEIMKCVAMMSKRSVSSCEFHSANPSVSASAARVAVAVTTSSTSVNQSSKECSR